jgi:indolepyruvate ferredoxin oxidoreductase beta subunit
MGLDVKVSEVHGMAQRGGSVITYVRIGERVFSPVIEPVLLILFWPLKSWRACAGHTFCVVAALY